jgi:hypothetical protein
MAKKTVVQAQTIESHADSPWLGRGLAIAAALVVVLMGVGWMSGALSDALVGVVLAAVVGLAASGRAASSLLDSAGTPATRVGVLALAAVTVALAVVPVALTIYPGTPVAAGVLESTGDSIKLPESVSGPVRLLVHAALSSAGSASVEFELGGLSGPVEGKLQRTVSTARVGRRGVTQQANERNSEFLDARIASGGHAVKLERVDGPLAGGLDVRVYSDRFPLWLDVVLAVLALVGVALVGVRLGVGTDTLVAAGVAVAFGAVGHEFVTPDSIVRPLIGAAIVAAVVGGAAGGILAWVARKVLPPPARAARA